MNCAEEAGIKPDMIVGDMDSVEEARLSKYPAESIIRHPADKDYTDTELAMRLAQDRGCSEIWIIGGGGGRLDHLLGIRALFERDVFPARWITDKEDIYCIDSMKNEQLAMSNEQALLRSGKEMLVSVFPLGDGPWKAKSAGLKWPLDNLNWFRGFFGLSNIALDGKFIITAEQGRFMVIFNKII